MKRLAALFVVFGMCSAALFAQRMEWSFGLGGNFTADFSSYVLTAEAEKEGVKPKDLNHTLKGGGFYLFFDGTYLESDVGLLFGNFNFDSLNGLSEDEKKGLDLTALKIGAFLKFPINLGSVSRSRKYFTIFPKLGVDFQLSLDGKLYGKTLNADGEELFSKMFTQIWFKLGLGADIPLAGSFYVRPEFLYGIRLNTEWESDYLDTASKTTSRIIGHGLDVHLAIGYKF